MTIERLGRYEVIRELGWGGMATVYLARDPNFNRQVAIKVLPRQFTHDPRFRGRFRREAQTVAALEHTAIVPVYDFEAEGELPFLVMRYLSGGTLADRLKAGPLTPSAALPIVRRIASALDYAHQQGVVHRDLKPGNILFDGTGLAYLSDFGILRLAEATASFTGSAIIGTPAYMSPEQVVGDRAIDGRSDVYSLGIVLFEMLAGDVPYKGETPTKQLMKHLVEPVPQLLSAKPDLPPVFGDHVAKALAKEPADRFATAGALASALGRAVGGAADSTLLEAAPPTLGDATMFDEDEPAITRDTGYPGFDAAITDMEKEHAPDVVTPLPVPAIDRVQSVEEKAEPEPRRSFMPYLAGSVLVAAVIVMFLWLRPAGGDPEGNPVISEATETHAVAVVDETDTPPPSESVGATETLEPTAMATATVEPTEPASPTPTREPEIPTVTPSRIAQVAPTVAPTHTSAPLPTATATEPPPPTATTAITAKSAQIRSIHVDESSRYIVDFVVTGYTPQLPGEHLHFFFNTVSAANAGVPGSGPWQIYPTQNGQIGTSPFTLYTVSHRPEGATEMCVLVANPDHSVQHGTGNCWALP